MLIYNNLFKLMRYNYNMRMLRNFSRIIAGSAFCLGLAFLAGCEGEDESQIIEGADENADFSITYPVSGQKINANPITIKGVGLRDVSSFRVRVYTDDWYEQTGSYSKSSNNSWKYSDVYISGTGEYNNHTIEATVTHSDGTSDSSTITGIKR